MYHSPLIFLFFISIAYAAYEDARCKCLCTDQSENVNNTKPTMRVFVKATSADKCTCKFMLGHEDFLCPYCECKYQVRNTTTIKVVVFLILVVISGLTLYMIFLLLLEPLLSVRSSSSASRLADDSMSSTSVCVSTAPDDVVDRKGHRNVLWRLVTSPFTRRGTPSAMNLQSNGLVGDGDRGKRGHAESPSASLNSRQLSKQQLLPGQAKSAAGEVESYLYQRFPTSSRVEGDRSEQAANQTGVAVPLSGPSGVSTVVNRVRDQQQRWKGNVQAQRARVFSEHSLLN